MYYNGLVSVIMPTYNTDHEMLSTAINSILKQTYTNLKFIVIDDGSKNDDNYCFIKKSFFDDRLIVLKNETNMGVAKTLNRALDLSEGKYVFRMDADDIALPNRIKTSVRFMENNPQITIAGSYARCFGNKRQIIKLPIGNDYIRSEMIYNNPLCHPTVVIRKSFIDKYDVRYPENASNEDYNLWVSLLSHKDTIFANIPKVLLMYRVHDAQVTTAKYEKLKRDSRIIVEKVLKYYLNTDINSNWLEAYIKAIYGREIVSKEEFEIMIDLFQSIIKTNNSIHKVHSDSLQRMLLKKAQNSYSVQVLRFKNYINVQTQIRKIGHKTGNIKSDLSFWLASRKYTFERYEECQNDEGNRQD